MIIPSCVLGQFHERVLTTQQIQQHEVIKEKVSREINAIHRFVFQFLRRSCRRHKVITCYEGKSKKI